MKRTLTFLTLSLAVACGPAPQPSQNAPIQSAKGATVSVVLGVDGGGTKTHAVIIDETGRTLGEGFGGPTNIDDHDLETATVHLETAVNQARANAQLKNEPFDAAFLGIAGVVSAADKALVRKFSWRLELTCSPPAGPHATGPEQLGVDHDARVALAGGLSCRPGMVLIAGTGSACFGMNAAGEHHLAGGWGHLLSDEGSGYWLGLEALRAAVRGFDGRGPPRSSVGHSTSWGFTPPKK